MKRLIYQVYTGKRSALYDHCTQSVKEYADRIGSEYIIQREPILRIAPDIFTTNRSRESYEKYGGFLPIYEKEPPPFFLYSEFGRKSLQKPHSFRNPGSFTFN